MTASVLSQHPPAVYICIKRNTMDEMKGVAALKTAETVTKTGGTFTIVFFPYSRAKRPNGPVHLKKFEGCTMRKPLHHE